MMLGDFTGLAGFIAAMVVMILLVPSHRVKELSLVGLVGGLGLALVVVYLLQNVFGAWFFIHADIVNLAGIPLFLSAAWIPLIIMYSHYMTKGGEGVPRTAQLLVFAAIPVLAHWFMLSDGTLMYRGWNLLFTYILAIVIHVGLLAYLSMTSKIMNR